MDLSARMFRVFFPASLYQTRNKSIHLTFDDGPHPEATVAVLEILRQFNIQATFFLTGSRVRQFPDLAKEIAANHHSVGNHAYHHRNLLFQPKKIIFEEIESGNTMIRETTGRQPTMFRPPYGYYDYRTLRVVQSLGMRLVHWSHDLRDFTGRLSSGSHLPSTRNIVAGSILLLHDNEATAPHIKSYLPPLVDTLIGQGSTFAALE